MKTLFTILLVVGMYSVYGQYGYVPQIPVDALYRNLQYKQELFDKRQAQVQERIDYSYSLIKRLNNSDYDYYLKTLNENVGIMGKEDLADSDVFYSIWNWFNSFDEKIKARIP